MTGDTSGSLRVGLVGCGRIAGFFHLPVLAGTSGVELAALADPDAERLAAAGARAPGAKRFADLRSLLDGDAVDAVAICLPPALHAEAAVAAFEAGKHVYLEKPLALDAAGAGRVVRAWRASGRVGVVGFNFRFNPLYEDARRRVAAGELGRVIAARATFCSAARALPPWKRTKAGGGGALRDLGAHHLDLVPHVLGAPIARIAGAERTVATEGDAVTLRLDLENGVAVDCFLSLATGVNANRLEVFGTEGRLVVDAAEAFPAPLERAEGKGARLVRLKRALAGLHPRRIARSPGAEPSFALALHAFVAAARAGRPAAPDVADGLRAVQAVEAAEAAIASGGAVAVVATGAPAHADGVPA